MKQRKKPEHFQLLYYFPPSSSNPINKQKQKCKIFGTTNYNISSWWSLDLCFYLKNSSSEYIPYQFNGKWKGIYSGSLTYKHHLMKTTVFLCTQRKIKTTNPIFFKVSFEDTCMSEPKSSIL